MAGQCSKVLKKCRISVAGAAPTQAAPAPRPADGQPEIRTVERQSDGAVLEIRCACGRHTYMHVRWPGPGAPAGPPTDGKS